MTCVDNVKKLLIYGFFNGLLYCNCVYTSSFLHLQFILDRIKFVVTTNDGQIDV